jgi:enoyl-CoA hydratase/carnithine racemase
MSTRGEPIDVEAEPGVTIGLVSAEQVGESVEVVLRRPEKRNAFNRDLAEQAVDALIAIDRDPRVKAVILRGAGGTLSAGADVSDAEELGASRSAYTSDPRARLLRLVRAMAIPTIAVVDGYALGLGLGLAGAATFAVATPRSVFGMPEAPMGFFPFGVVPYLIDRVAVTTVIEWALTARRFSAADAAAAGLVTHLADVDVELAVRPLVDSLCALPRHVLVAGVEFARRARTAIPRDELIAWCEAAVAEGSR